MKIGWVSAVPLLLVSSVASAQSVQVQVGVPPPPPPPPPPTVYVAPPPPAYGYYGPRRPMYERGDLDRPRLRLAFGATGGPFVGGNVGGAGGFWGQAGVQINRLIAVYYQTHAMLGVVGLRQSGALDVYNSFFGGIWNNEAMIDFTIHDVFQVGVGPSFDVYSVNSFNEGFPGADARIGVALGRIGPWRRTGFMLGVDIHPTFVTDNTFPTTSVITSVLVTIGGGWY